MRKWWHDFFQLSLSGIWQGIWGLIFLSILDASFFHHPTLIQFWYFFPVVSILVYLLRPECPTDQLLRSGRCGSTPSLFIVEQGSSNPAFRSLILQLQRIKQALEVQGDVSLAIMEEHSVLSLFVRSKNQSVIVLSKGALEHLSAPAIQAVIQREISRSHQPEALLLYRMESTLCSYSSGPARFIERWILSLTQKQSLSLLISTLSVSLIRFAIAGPLFLFFARWLSREISRNSRFPNREEQAEWEQFAGLTTPTLLPFGNLIASPSRVFPGKLTEFPRFPFSIFQKRA